MHFFRSIYHHSYRGTVYPFLAEIKTCMRKPGNSKSNEVGHGSAAYKQSAGTCRKTKELFKPADHLRLNKAACLVATTLVQVDARRQHVSHHRKWTSATHHPAPKTRMNISGRIRQDLRFEISINIFYRFPFCRRLLLKIFFYFLRRGLPYFSFAHGGKELH